MVLKIGSSRALLKTHLLDRVAALQGASVALTTASGEHLRGRSGGSGDHQREAEEEEGGDAGDAGEHVERMWLTTKSRAKRVLKSERGNSSN